MARYVSRDEALGSPVRRELLDWVATRPGVTMKDLADRFQREPSTILWHTTKLVKAGLLRSERVGHHRVFYLTGPGVPLRDHVVTQVHLGHRLARRLHEAITASPGITFNGLAELLRHREATLRFHLRRLLEAGLVCPGPSSGRAVHYYAQPTAARPCPASAERAAAAGGGLAQAAG